MVTGVVPAARESRAYSIHMPLWRDIGPARAGSFAFVSPAIAVGVGTLLAGETITRVGVTGMILMLMAPGGSLFAEQLTTLFSPARKVKPESARR